MDSRTGTRVGGKSDKGIGNGTARTRAARTWTTWTRTAGTGSRAGEAREEGRDKGKDRREGRDKQSAVGHSSTRAPRHAVTHAAAAPLARARPHSVSRRQIVNS
jgi:hypothetical protein